MSSPQCRVAVAPDIDSVFNTSVLGLSQEYTCEANPLAGGATVLLLNRFLCRCVYANSVIPQGGWHEFTGSVVR